MERLYQVMIVVDFVLIGISHLLCRNLYMCINVKN